MMLPIRTKWTPYDAAHKDKVDPKVTDLEEKLNLSDWDKLNNEVTRLTQEVGDLTMQNNIQGAGMSDLNERLGKLEGLVETLEAGFNTEYKILHDDQKKLMDTLETQLGTIRDLHDIVKTQSSSIAGLQRRVMIWEGSPPLPEKKATSKMLLKRFLAVQRICEASIELDTNSKVAPLPTDRRWLAQSVLNILKGNVDE